MNKQSRTSVSHFRNSNFKHKIEKTANPAKLVHQKFYAREKILRTRDYRRKFIRNLLPKKRKENM